MTTHEFAAYLLRNPDLPLVVNAWDCIWDGTGPHEVCGVFPIWGRIEEEGEEEGLLMIDYMTPDHPHHGEHGYQKELD